MIGLIIVGSIHSILLDFLSFISSIRLCGSISPPTPDNFERGFYSIPTSPFRYRFNSFSCITIIDRLNSALFSLFSILFDNPLSQFLVYALSYSMIAVNALSLKCWMIQLRILFYSFHTISMLRQPLSIAFELPLLQGYLHSHCLFTPFLTLINLR